MYALIPDVRTSHIVHISYVHILHCADIELRTGGGGAQDQAGRQAGLHLHFLAHSLPDDLHAHRRLLQNHSNVVHALRHSPALLARILLHQGTQQKSQR